jgi:hypothetical protein
MSVFREPGLYLRHPQGGVEDVAAMRLDGFRAVALNVADHALDEWQKVIVRAQAADVRLVLWGRLETIAARRSMTVLQACTWLCDLARRLGWPVIVNAERELKDGRIFCAQIAERAAGLDACLSTEPWLGGVDLTPLGDIEVHLQLFPQENDDSTRPRDCRAGAFALGARRVSFMYGMHGLTTTAFPFRQAPFWVYTADDIGGFYSVWSPQVLPALAIPYTGPLYGPSHRRFGTTPHATETARALKMALHRAGFGTFPRPDPYYNELLERAMKRLQRWAGIVPVSGAYGRASYEAIRRLASVVPFDTYALRSRARKLIFEDAKLRKAA